MKYSDIMFGSGGFILIYGILNIAFGNEPVEPIVLVYVGFLNVVIGWAVVLCLKTKKELVKEINGEQK